MKRTCKIIPNIKKPSLDLTKIAESVLLSIMISSNAFAESTNEVQFNKAFLRSAVDISAYSQGNPVPEGNHSVNLYLNDRWKGRTDVKFKNTDIKSSVAQPCFNTKLIAVLGIDTTHLAKEWLTAIKNDDSCVRLSDLAQDLNASYDISTQQLNIHAPQIYLLRNARGYISPELWDNGIPAATLQYNYNAWHSEQSDTSSFSTQYLGLYGGINWDAWRLRFRGALNWNNNQDWHYDNANIYLERALIPLRSKLVLGEFFTDGQVFDSIGFRGIMMTSDDRMYESSQRGYAPIINGIANTNALVQIRQRGTLIYETTVPSGPFIINDLYPTGAGGDLLVTIKEADGSERSFNVTYSSIAELLRPGTTRYSLMGGRYHNSVVNEDPEIFLATLKHGFNNLITGYAGVLGGKDYQAVSGGVALNTPFGAISSDITHASTNFRDDNKREGQSIRFSFAKILPVINTNITLASYRYSSSGYYNINDAMLMRSNQWNDYGWYTTSINRKNRIQLSASQNISDSLGNINISASTQDYWNRDGRDTEYQFGYSNAFKWFNFNLNASRTKDLLHNEWDNKIAIGVSFPLGNSAKSAYLNSTYTQERDHNGFQNSIAGTTGINRQYNYNAYINVDRYEDNNIQTTGGVGGNWTSPWATIGGNFSVGNNYRQYGMNLSGGAIAYQNGLVLTPIMGDTMAIIEAEHAGGAKIANNTSLSLDNNGKAAVPYLTPYRQNSIELDPKGLSNDIELQETSQNSVPTAGAVILMKYKTDIGHSALFNIQHAEQELPFGAPLIDESNEIVGYISQGGQGFARMKREKGKLTVQWGTESPQKCQFSYEIAAKELSSKNDNTLLRQHNVLCQ